MPNHVHLLAARPLYGLQSRSRWPGLSGDARSTALEQRHHNRPGRSLGSQDFVEKILFFLGRHFEKKKKNPGRKRKRRKGKYELCVT